MLKKREDIDQKYKWNLDSLYPSDQAWEDDYKLAEAMFEELKKMEGSILSSSENFKKNLELSLDSSRKVSRIATYAKMKQDENTKDSHYQELNGRASNLGVKFSEATSYIVPEMMMGDEETIRNYLKEDGLKLYTQHVNDILRARPHTLTPGEEAIMAGASELFTAPSTAFGMLNGADLKFPNVGKDSLTHGSFIPFMMKKDRAVREEAFKKYYKVFDEHKNTFASLLSSEVKKNIFNAKARKHTSARACALHDNNVPESVYDNLIEAVHKNLPAMHRYIDLRKKMLRVDKLRPFDLYVPLIDDVDMKYAYEDGRDTVLKSLEILGDDYLGPVRDAFEDSWIDVYENEGKRSGAYSWGTYDSKPYILLNYHDELGDVFTLTHEMGHSMHSYLTRKNQPYVYGNYSIFVAEVASTTNEALLNKYLLDNVKEKNERLYLLNNYLENFRGTVFRQTMFAEFERDIHAYAADGGALTADQLCKMYRDLNAKYYGESLDIDAELDLEWARIPHFYYNFYVFQYATGFSSAVALADKMVNEGQQAVSDYKSFLGAGCSDYPIEVLKAAGVDMTTPEPVDNALNVFNALVEEMEKLINL
ncbi:oligoendopeptidase F [Acidaminobacter sp. JC074]|uniref:oligoendopeptidase F n=1 Tax=Acidaminobacter sp. JC074 TaxID=2530199 RepID=UPI001F0D6B22|nr:oligoendopeptidase F [Acidaminobacter sp. JC074]MCH4888856.1 oligoendopeptidase F [Acidaminobacter sp. JC074]